MNGLLFFKYLFLKINFIILKKGKFQHQKKLENISNLIGKNRKIINLKFEKITKNNENINFLDAVKVLEDVLSIKMDTNEWLKILNFAIKDNFLDYKFMMDVFKNRLIDVNSHPKDLSNIDSDNFLKNS